MRRTRRSRSVGCSVAQTTEWGLGTTMTALSAQYRRRASEFARVAGDHHAEGRRDEAMRAVQSALFWIHLAEDEELLGARAGMQCERPVRRQKSQLMTVEAAVDRCAWSED